MNTPQTAEHADTARRVHVELETPPSAPVAQLAMAAVMKHGEDSDAATTQLLAELRKRYREFYEWKAARAMRQWAFEQIRLGRSTLRKTIVTGPKGRETKSHQALDAESLAAVATLYDWPLVTGQKLGDATRSDIDSSVDKYATDAETYARRERFLRAVQTALPDEDTPVRDALTLDAIDALARDAGLAPERDRAAL